VLRMPCAGRELAAGYTQVLLPGGPACVYQLPMAGFERGFMRFSKILILIIALMSLGMLSAVRAQQSTVAPQANPVPPTIRPNYNYSEAFSCTACHFVMGTGGDHNLEAVWGLYDGNPQQINITRVWWVETQKS